MTTKSKEGSSYVTDNDKKRPGPGDNRNDEDERFVWFFSELFFFTKKKYSTWLQVHITTKTTVHQEWNQMVS